MVYALKRQIAAYENNTAVDAYLYGNNLKTEKTLLYRI